MRLRFFSWPCFSFSTLFWSLCRVVGDKWGIPTSTCKFDKLIKYYMERCNRRIHDQTFSTRLWLLWIRKHRKPTSCCQICNGRRWQSHSSCRNQLPVRGSRSGLMFRSWNLFVEEELFVPIRIWSWGSSQSSAKQNNITAFFMHLRFSGYKVFKLKEMIVDCSLFRQ